MPFTRVNNIDLHYEEYGEGPHLIVAHGLLGSVATMSLFGDRLEEIAGRGVHVVAYDARGHGLSQGRADWRQYTWQALAEDMYGLMRALGIEKASIYGGSMGAGAALALALAHPEAVDRLVLRSPPAVGQRLKPVQAMFLALAMLYRVGGPRLTGAIVARRPGRADPSFDIARFLRNQQRKPIIAAIRGVLLDGPQLPVHRYSEIEQPALILTHPEDGIHPVESGEMLHERLKHAKLAVAPSSTYWAENPAGLAHVIASFVRGESIARGLPDHRHVEATHAPTAADVVAVDQATQL